MRGCRTAVNETGARLTLWPHRSRRSPRHDGTRGLPADKLFRKSLAFTEGAHAACCGTCACGQERTARPIARAGLRFGCPSNLVYLRGDGFGDGLVTICALGICCTRRLPSTACDGKPAESAGCESDAPGFGVPSAINRRGSQAGFFGRCAESALPSWQVRSAQPGWCCREVRAMAVHRAKLQGSGLNAGPFVHHPARVVGKGFLV